MAVHTDTSAHTHVHSKDPVTDAPDFHPVGTGVGAATGGVVAGAVVGSVAGPVGTAIGAAAGAVLGGLAGKAVAHRVDSDLEDAYWLENHVKQPYVAPGTTYDDYRPAYRYGAQTFETHAGRPFDEVEPDLGRDWESAKDRSSLSWEQAKHATRASWHRLSDRVERAIPGDSDRDGK
jgi:hypothetical protein